MKQAHAKKFNITAITTLSFLVASMLPGFAMAYTSSRTSYSATYPVREPVIQRIEPRPDTTMTARQINLQKDKELLSGMLNQLEAHFQKTREKASSLQKLTEASGVDIVKTIDNYLAQIKTLKSKVSNVQTSEELKKIAQEVHGLIQEAKQEVQKNIGQRVEVHIDKFKQRTATGEKLVDEAKVKIEGLKNRGTNLQNMDASLEECKKLLQKGDRQLNDAKAKFEQLKTVAPDQRAEGARLMKDGMKMVNDARGTYSQARKNCSNVIRGLKDY